MKLHPTAGPKIAQTTFRSWWSLVSTTAITPAPAASAARTIANMRAAVMPWIISPRRGAASRSASGLAVSDQKRELRLPLRRVGLLGRVGEVELEPACPRLAVPGALRLPPDAVLVSPGQQVPRRVDETL